MLEKYFIDSNVWLYLLLADDNDKYLAAKRFIDSCISHDKVVVSWQVINEVSANLLKNRFSESEIVSVVKWLLKIAEVQDFSEDVLLLASSLRKNHLFSFWDSLILSAALEANCDYVVSEDMQHNQLLNRGLKIINPFL